MRTAVTISLLAVISAWGAAPQDAKPPQQDPPAAAPKTAAPPDADPMKMAAPNATSHRPVPSSVDDKTFVLGAEDQIYVFVYQAPEFTASHMIRPDGKITVNLVGDVQAAGLTPENLAKEIKGKVKAFLNDPDVTVSVTAVKSKKFFIQGEVNKPGEYPLIVPTRVLEALVNAGGFKDFANQKKITIIHSDNTRQFFNYKDVIKGKHLEQNIYLTSGDIIIVK